MHKSRKYDFLFGKAQKDNFLNQNRRKTPCNRESIRGKRQHEKTEKHIFAECYDEDIRIANQGGPVLNARKLQMLK